MRHGKQTEREVGRAEQMRRDIATTAAMVLLVLLVLVAAGPEKALAQTVTTDQYSDAASEAQYQVDDYDQNWVNDGGAELVEQVDCSSAPR